MIQENNMKLTVISNNDQDNGVVYNAKGDLVAGEINNGLPGLDGADTVSLTLNPNGTITRNSGAGGHSAYTGNTLSVWYDRGAVLGDEGAHSANYDITFGSPSISQNNNSFSNNFVSVTSGSDMGAGVTFNANAQLGVGGFYQVTWNIAITGTGTQAGKSANVTIELRLDNGSLP